MKKINFEDGTLVKNGYVEIDGVQYPVVKAQYTGKTPLSSYNLNNMQDNIETALEEEVEQKTNEAINNKVVSFKNAVIEDSAQLKDCGNLTLKSLNAIIGKTEQEVRSGKNLFNINDRLVTTNGITIDDEGWITVTCDNSSGTESKFYNIFTNSSELLKTSTNYSIITEIKNVSGTGYLAYVSFATSYDSQFTQMKTHKFIDLSSNSVKKEIATTKSNFSSSQSMLRSFIGFDAGASGSITFRLSVLEDTGITADTFEYEAYGKAPTPNFPSEVKTVTGNVEVGICNKNFFGVGEGQSTNFGVAVDYNESELTLNGTTTEKGNMLKERTEKTQIMPGYRYIGKFKAGTYYYNCNVIKGSVNIPSGVDWAFYIRKPNTKSLLSYGKNSPNYKGSFIVEEDTDLYLQMFVNNQGVVFDNYTFQIQIEKGTEATDFVKHKGGNYPLTLGDILLYEGNKIYKENGKWYKYIEWFKEILESNKIWNVSGTYNGSLYTGVQKYVENVGVYCNIAKGVKNLSEYAEGCCVIANSNINLWLPGLSTSNLLNEYLANNEVYIVGKLKTPIIEEITDTTLIAQLNALENAKLHEGITNISITGDTLTPIADIDYWTWFKGEDAETEVTDYEISNLPEHSGGANSYMLKKTGNIVVLAVDNIWINSITANMWIDIGTVPEELRPEKTIQGMVIGSRGDTGNVGAYGKMGVTADGVIRCKMNSDINLLSAFSFNIMWII